MDLEPQLTKPTKHPDLVKRHMESDDVSEPVARKLTARDLILERVRKENAANKELTFIDTLTKLPNRLALLGDKKADSPIIGSLDRALAHTKRTGEKLSLMMIDVDHLKEINDTFGHQEGGDKVLRELAERLRLSLREADIPARYAGDEFIVVLPNTDIEGALTLAEKLRLIIAENDGLQKITISGGVVEYDPETHKSSKDLIEAADKRLYQAKDLGRNRIESELIEK